MSLNHRFCWCASFIYNKPIILFIIILSVPFSASQVFAHPEMDTLYSNLQLFQGGREGGVFLVDKFAYLADGQNLRVFDISNPRRPFQVGFHEAGNAAQEVHVVGDIAYVAAYNEGVRILKISSNLDEPELDLEEIAVVSGIDAWDIFADENYLYVAAWKNNGLIYDVSDPSNPEIVRSNNGLGFPVTLPTTDAATGIWVQDNYAYITDSGNKGLRTYEISTPESPDEERFFVLNGIHEKVSVYGEWAYLASGPDGFYIIYVGDPSDTDDDIEYGPYNYDMYAREVVVENGIAYVAYQEGSIRVFNVADPAAPVELDQYDTSNPVMGVAVRDGIIYAAVSSEGLVIPNEPSCYELSTFAFDGGSIITDPANSEGCPEGHYAPEEKITLRANPESGWNVHFWEGTEDNNSTAAENLLTMPAADHVVSVVYRLNEVAGISTKPLPRNHPNIGPPGEPLFVGEMCCLGGFVYHNGASVESPSVTLSYGNDESVDAEIYTEDGQSYFSIDLKSHNGLTISDTVTLTARAGMSLTHAISYTLQPGPQQVDIVLPSGGANIPPIATVSQRSHIGIVDEDDQMFFSGMGHASALNASIAAYEWTSSLDGILREKAILPLGPDLLTSGNHTISFRVQDNNDTWSVPVEFPLEVRSSKDGWTLLLYLASDYDGDGDLTPEFNDIVDSLANLTPKPENVNILILQDSPNFTLLKAYNSEGELAVTCSQVTNSEWLNRSDAAMNRYETLRDFLVCADELFDDSHIYLSIANHGHAVLGTAWDFTSEAGDEEVQYLSTGKIDDAISEAGIGKIDVLHLDSCSMNLLETAYELHEVADYLVSSQFLIWGTFPYAAYIHDLDANTLPGDLARSITYAYVDSVPKLNGIKLPYTISVLNLNLTQEVHGALNAFVQEIEDAELSAEVLKEVRIASQVLESAYEYNNYQHEPEQDFYVDLGDWVRHLIEHPATAEAPDVIRSGRELLGKLSNVSGFIVENDNHSATMPDVHGGHDIDLSAANGVSIFYPVEGLSRIRGEYERGELFAMTETSKWDEFLRDVPVGSPSGAPSDAPLLPLAPLGQFSTSLQSPTPQPATSVYIPLLTQ